MDKSLEKVLNFIIQIVQALCTCQGNIHLDRVMFICTGKCTFGEGNVHMVRKMYKV